MDNNKNRIIEIRTCLGYLFRVYEKDSSIHELGAEPSSFGSQPWTLEKIVKSNGSKVYSTTELFDLAEADKFVEFESHANRNGEVILRNKNRSPKLFIQDSFTGCTSIWVDGIANITLVKE